MYHDWYKRETEDDYKGMLRLLIVERQFDGDPSDSRKSFNKLWVCKH